MKYLLVAALLLPSVPGSWETLKRGGEEIRVYRDDWGIPHVFAKTPAGAFWAQGYLECQDRFWQMDLFRRGSQGRGAELRGKEAVASDRDRLRRGYTEEELRAMVESGGLASAWPWPPIRKASTSGSTRAPRCRRSTRR